MKTEKIIADSMPQALKMVRQKLGDNAIIVNTKVIKTGGVFGLFTKQKYEVIAYSVDKKENKPEPVISMENKETFALKVNPSDSEFKENNSGFHKKPQNLYNYYAKNEGKDTAEPEVPKKPDHDPALLDELQQMRKMMMNFVMNDKGGAMPAELSKYLTSLRKQGVDEEVIQYIVSILLKKYETIQDVNDQQIKDELATVIEEIVQKRIPTSTEIDDHIGMINVIGPTGVGKTTTIAKLATEQVLKQKRRVAMITTDVYRIAAVEQLKTYASILNVPIEVVRTPVELEAALKNLQHHDLIYMDTTGRNYKELKHRQTIHEYLNNPLKSDNYLVLSLTSKYEDMEILLNEFLESPVKKLILTKFDETSSYGAIVNLAYHFPYMISYVTTGQSVPEDIAVLDASILAKTLLGVEV